LTNAKEIEVASDLLIMGTTKLFLKDKCRI